MNAIVKIGELSTRIGTVIPSIQGRIVNVFPPKTGKSEHGNWKLQSISIQDESGKCQVTLSGIEDTLTEEHKDMEIHLESKGTKFGLKGVTCEEREWSDSKTGQVKKSIGLKVTKTALIKIPGMEMVQQDAKDDIPMDFKPLDKGIDERMKLPKDFSNNKTPSTTLPEERIAQYRELYDLCFSQATRVNITDEKERPTLDLIKDISTTFFIQACKEGLADKMEVKEEVF